MNFNIRELEELLITLQKYNITQFSIEDISLTMLPRSEPTKEISGPQAVWEDPDFYAAQPTYTNLKDK